MLTSHGLLGSDMGRHPVVLTTLFISFTACEAASSRSARLDDAAHDVTSNDFCGWRTDYLNAWNKQDGACVVQNMAGLSLPTRERFWFGIRSRPRVPCAMSQEQLTREVSGFIEGTLAFNADQSVRGPRDALRVFFGPITRRPLNRVDVGLTATDPVMGKVKASLSWLIDGYRYQTHVEVDTQMYTVRTHTKRNATGQDDALCRSLISEDLSISDVHAGTAIENAILQKMWRLCVS